MPKVQQLIPTRETFVFISSAKMVFIEEEM